MDENQIPSDYGLSQQNFERFARFITRELGIKMPCSKLTMVQSRLLRRVRELGLENLDQYSEYFFASSASEREHFISAITTNKTDFFREPDHFHFLKNTVLPSIASATRGLGCVKVWSAACSSGEEPYTLAMILTEFARQERGMDFTILATDVSLKVLEQARSAVYAEALIDPVPPELRRKYLLRSKNSAEALVRIVPELRQKISFHCLNFMDESYGVKNRFDVIFLRNVLIYFEKDTQEEVVNKLCRNLVPGGYLFIGHSESLAGMDVPLQCVGPAIFRKPAGNGRR